MRGGEAEQPFFFPFFFRRAFVDFGGVRGWRKMRNGLNLFLPSPPPAAAFPPTRYMKKENVYMVYNETYMAFLSYFVIFWEVFLYIDIIML